MKHQYFADRHDFYKYELLLDLAEGHSMPARLLSVLMLTPNDETAEGSIEAYELGRRRQDLFGFLKHCLAEGTRDLSLLRRFMSHAGMDYRPLHDDSYFDDTQRQNYFDECAEAAREYPLVFFDPDIGLETRARNYMRQMGAEKYLMYSDISTVANAAAPESVFVVYQHLQRNKTRVRSDLDTRCRGLCRALGGSSATFVTDWEVAFLVAGCGGRSNAWAREAVTSHGVKHGLHVGEVAVERTSPGHGGRQTDESRTQLPRPMDRTLGRQGAGVKADSQESATHVRRHVVSSRNGCQVMVAGLKLRELGYRRGARVEVTDARGDPGKEPWNYIVSNNEHATLVSRLPSPPEWIQPEVLIDNMVRPPLGGNAGSRLPSRSTAVSIVTARDLAEWRSTLIKLLNQLEGTTRPTGREGLASRIERLTRANRIPRVVASLMRAVTEMRNQTEYEEKVLTASESAAVAGRCCNTNS